MEPTLKQIPHDFFGNLISEQTGGCYKLGNTSKLLMREVSKKLRLWLYAFSSVEQMQHLLVVLLLKLVF